MVTLFPPMFAALTDFGITRRAFEAGLVSLDCWNPRDYTADRHQTVDDRPYGGGPGMVMMPEPLAAAIRDARIALGEADGAGEIKVACLSPAGRLLDEAGVQELAARPGLILVAGRYEGIDQRVLDAEVDEEWSIGDYVLSGGELAAMVMLDAVVRQLPGALGHQESAAKDSFADGLLEHPQYTRPENWSGRGVPPVLSGGNHAEIARWRRMQSLGRTRERRPDIFERLQLDAESRALLDQYQQEQAASKGGPED